MVKKKSYEKMLSERNRLREEWRLVREKRLKLKEKMLTAGNDIHSIRKDREFRDLRKKQRRLSLLIKHLERRINRKQYFNDTKK